MRPGQIVLTVMRSAATSSDSVFAYPSTPAHVATDRPNVGIGCSTDSAVMLTMLPPPAARRCGTACRVSRTTLIRFCSTAFDHAPSSNVVEPAERRRAVVVDQHVESAERGVRRCDDALAILGLADVGRDGDRSPAALRRHLRDRLVERLAPPRDHRDVGTFGGEQPRDREADALARTADDRRLAAEREVHRSVAGAAREPPRRVRERWRSRVSSGEHAARVRPPPFYRRGDRTRCERLHAATTRGANSRRRRPVQGVVATRPHIRKARSMLARLSMVVVVLALAGCAAPDSRQGEPAGRVLSRRRRPRAGRAADPRRRRRPQRLGDRHLRGVRRARVPTTVENVCAAIAVIGAGIGLPGRSRGAGPAGDRAPRDRPAARARGRAEARARRGARAHVVERQVVRRAPRHRAAPSASCPRSTRTSSAACRSAGRLLADRNPVHTARADAGERRVRRGVRGGPSRIRIRSTARCATSSSRAAAASTSASRTCSTTARRTTA